MAVVISGVLPGSPAVKKGILAGEKLVSVNGNPVFDVLDYRFYISDSDPLLGVEGAGRVKREVRLDKAEEEESGLCFETYLMDKQRHCANKCIFCFIDQLPPGLRESLYFKDDDARLSFLHGNYISLTNLSEREARRIVDMHISPVNVSVHTTDPALRCRMLGNAKAGGSLALLERFAAGGIKINAQIVLCPGINDGPQLERTLRDLGALVPGVQSIAVVPVGLTRFREGLPEIKPYDKDGARAVIETVARFNETIGLGPGETVAYPADEFYLKAQLPVPPSEEYGDFCQLENGVGLWTLFRDSYLKELSAHKKLRARGGLRPRQITVATGTAAYPLIRLLVDETLKKCDNLKVNTLCVDNLFFGENITVAGLLTGADYTVALKGRPLGDEVLIPASSLRSEGDMFLDSMTPAQLEQALCVKITPVSTDAREFLGALLGKAR